MPKISTQDDTVQVVPPTKRSTYRVHFKLAESPQIQIQLEPDLRRPAWVQNLSDTGAFLRLEGDHPSINAESMITCHIRLAGLELLGCDAIVRHRQYLPKLDESKLGVEFWQLSNAYSQKLHTLLMKLQRRNIRTDLTL